MSSLFKVFFTHCPLLTWGSHGGDEEDVDQVDLGVVLEVVPAAVVQPLPQ